MSRRWPILLALALSASQSALRAEEPAQDPPSGAENQASIVTPPPHEPDRTPRTVAFPVEPRQKRGAAASAGPLEGVRVLSARAGEAQLAFGEREVTLRPGDTVDGDLVKSVEPGRIVFQRSGTAVGEAIVVMSFDAQGRARVRVFTAKDPTAVVPLPAR